MRKITTLILFFAVTTAFAQSNEKYSVGIGTNMSFQRHSDLSSKPGYFAVFSVSNKLTETMGYYGSVQYNHEEAEFGNTTLKVNSAVATFSYTYSPVSAFDIHAGFFLGMTLNGKVAGEDIEDLEKGIAGVQGALAYNFNRFQIQARYSHYLTDHVFDSSLQLGVLYRLSNAD
jgi:hypothetical protein